MWTFFLFNFILCSYDNVHKAVTWSKSRLSHNKSLVIVFEIYIKAENLTQTSLLLKSHTNGNYKRH